MKKTLLLGLVSCSLMADTYFNLGVAQSDFKYQDERVSENVYSLGYGVRNTFRNGIYGDIQFNFDYANLENEYMIGYGSDLKLGIALGAKYKIYGIGSAQQQSFSKSANAYGFGYGGGISYDFTRNFVGYTDFKRYDMVESKGFDYTYDSLILGMKINF